MLRIASFRKVLKYILLTKIELRLIVDAMIDNTSVVITDLTLTYDLFILAQRLNLTKLAVKCALVFVDSVSHHNINVNSNNKSMDKLPTATIDNHIKHSNNMTESLDIVDCLHNVLIYLF